MIVNRGINSRSDSIIRN